MSARRRMFNLQLISEDDFIDLPDKAQLLFWHFLGNADDQGFLKNARSIIRNLQASESDLQALIDAGEVIKFDSGAILVTTFWQHNDRHAWKPQPTTCKDEFNLVCLDRSNKYILKSQKTEETDEKPCSVPDKEADSPSSHQTYTNVGENSHQSYTKNGEKRHPKERIKERKKEKASPSPSAIQEQKTERMPLDELRYRIDHMGEYVANLKNQKMPFAWEADYSRVFWGIFPTEEEYERAKNNNEELFIQAYDAYENYMKS